MVARKKKSIDLVNVFCLFTCLDCKLQGKCFCETEGKLKDLV